MLAYGARIKTAYGNRLNRRTVNKQKYNTTVIIGM